ncbi:putative holin-like toxin [Limosilactobacillus ingluviei]
MRWFHWNNSGRKGSPMSTFQALTLMIAFGMLVATICNNNRK